MIKQINYLLHEWFDDLVIECIDFFLPECLDCMIEDFFNSPPNDHLPEQIMAAGMETFAFAGKPVTNYSVVKDDTLFFDFNPN